MARRQAVGEDIVFPRAVSRASLRRGASVVSKRLSVHAGVFQGGLKGRQVGWVNGRNVRGARQVRSRRRGWHGERHGYLAREGGASSESRREAGS